MWESKNSKYTYFGKNKLSGFMVILSILSIEVRRFVQLVHYSTNASVDAITSAISVMITIIPRVVMLKRRLTWHIDGNTSRSRVLAGILPFYCIKQYVFSINNLHFMPRNLKITWNTTAYPYWSNVICCIINVVLSLFLPYGRNTNTIVLICLKYTSSSLASSMLLTLEFWIF